MPAKPEEVGLLLVHGIGEQKPLEHLRCAASEFASALSSRRDLARMGIVDRTGDTFPEKVTAFREGMAVHGRYGKPCPVCCTPMQRIRYASNEANYCPACQTGGKLLADRSLSRLLKGDWPRSLEELE